MTTDLQREIGAIVARRMDAGEITGGITLVARDGAIVALDVRGSADVDPGFALREDTIFGVMSMTKPVVAACAAILIAEGKLGRHDDVARYIPEFAQPRTVRTLRPGERYRIERFPPQPDAPEDPEPAFDVAPARRPITVHDLMSFTSGLQTIFIANPALPPLTPDDTLAGWVAKLGAVPLEFQPGTRWHYSNSTGYDVLGRIVEVAAGQPFGDFARERLFGPLGMTSTGFPGGVPAAERLLPLGPVGAAPIFRPGYHSGSAGLFSTAGDYWRFAQMLLDGGLHGGVRVMPAGAVALMRENQIGDLPFPGIRSIEYANPAPAPEGHPGLRYGYGVGLVTATTEDLPLPPGSYGWDGIGTRRFWVMPSRRTVLVMLMPGLGSQADATHREIEALVARA